MRFMKLRALLLLPLLAGLTAGCQRGLSVDDLVAREPTPVPSVTPGPDGTEPPSQAPAADVLYQASFEDAQDWARARPAKNTSGYTFPHTWSGYNNGNPAYPPPRRLDGTFLFDLFRVAPSLFDPPNVTNLAEVGAGYGRGGGKGLLYNVEVSGSYGVWTGGNPINIWLGGTQAAPTSYPELYLRFYLRYPPEWTWTNDANPIANRGAIQKVMKIVRYNGYLGDGGNPQLYVAPSGGGRIHPLWGMQWTQYISTTPSYPIFNNAERLSPDYSSNGVELSTGFRWPTDAEWHCYDFHVRMNSAPGLADGLEEVWVDGVLRFRKENVLFVKADGSTATGWNMVEVLDNVTLPSSPLASQVTYPLYVDDIVISKSYRGPPAAPVNVTAQRTSSSSVRLAWEAGTNGAGFRLDGYRIHYGTAAGQLTSIIDAGNVTAREIPGLQPGSTYYFALAAYNGLAGEAINESVKSPVVPFTLN